MQPTTTQEMIDYSICGVKVHENVECTGATNTASETVSLEECRALAEAMQYMQFSYNADKGKCFGVTPETHDACLEPIEDESEKWDFYEFWCSEGYTEEEVCLAQKVKPNTSTDQVTFEENLKKKTCNQDACSDVTGVATVEECMDMAADAGLIYFGYNKKQDKCKLCYDSEDAGYTECIIDYSSDTKSKVYFRDCNDVAFIGGSYYCENNDLSEYMGTMAETGMKCADASNGDSIEATVAECNNFAMDEGYTWFSYRSDQGLCFIPNNVNQEINCWNINTETGLAWDVYTVCGELNESLSDEQQACLGYEDCVGEECFVAFKNTEQSWKCDGITQDHKGVDFAYCVEYTMNMGYTFMNYRTSNGACGGVDECAPSESGSAWQIFIDCGMVSMDG
jgi:hypothetical protein